ncbi:MAG: type II secretion system F family protein [Acidimicrobiia bacterium]
MRSVLAIGCGLGWGTIFAVPLVGRARRQVVARRVELTAPIASAPRARWDGGVVARVGRGLLRIRRRQRRAGQIERELPTVLDLLAVAVGAGVSPAGALETVARWGPPLVVGPVGRALVSVRLGAALPEALDDLAAELPALHPVTDALIASARLGAPAGPTLARLGDESRSALRRRAEARARTLPVKLLFPLVLLVLPAFGLLTVAPAVISAMSHL